MDNIWRDALDPSYATATRARVGRGAGSSRHTWVASVAAAALVGGALTVAATQVRLADRQAGMTRSGLLTQVQRAETLAAGLAGTQDSLRASTSAQRQARLSTTAAGTAVAAAVTQLEAATAGTAVVGPGVTVTVGDAADADATTGRVQDRDLQDVVDALWAAGAEAVAVDGERIGPDTAIRTAGEAILVDFRPVTSPYVVAAIGNGNTLQTGYADSDAGARLETLEQLEGITVAVHDVASLHLAAASTPLPDHARPLSGGAS